MSKRLILSALLVCCGIGIQTSIIAQCFEPPAYISTSGCPYCYSVNPIGPIQQIGSSFQSCMDGYIVKIGISFNMFNRGDDKALLIIRDILTPGTPGTVGASKEITQRITINPGGGIQVFDLTSSYPVTLGSSHAWFLEQSTTGRKDIIIEGASENPYFNGGSMNGFSSGPSSNIDLAFQVTISPDPIIIPTLSEWGIITLSLTMLIIGVTSLRQREILISNRSMTS